MTTPATLALDLGTNAGWAFRIGLGAIHSGSWNLKPQRFEGGGMRFLRFRYLLSELNKMTPIRAIYFEEVRRHSGVDAAHVYGGLLATLSSWCEEQLPPIPYSGVPIGTWKKSIPGLKGNAGKEVVKAEIEHLGYAPTSFDEADAIGVLLSVTEYST